MGRLHFQLQPLLIRAALHKKVCWILFVLPLPYSFFLVFSEMQGLRLWPPLHTFLHRLDAQNVMLRKEFIILCFSWVR
jgi:hypothetical protein